ncbi:MAG: CBS domain-containing protein [Limisphaerales bacterium]|jgi:CBS domain-containing protein
MGELNVRPAVDVKDTQHFVRNLLRDVKALERMIEEDWFEKGVTRIGAEQELCLVDAYGKPAPVNLELLASANHEMLTSELARFNLEFNLEPLVFEGACLSQMEARINELYQLVITHADKLGVKPIMTGILPTIRKFDVSDHNLTPLDRYRALMDALTHMRGSDLELKIRGVDELRIRHDSPLLEGCNTGFQMHLQTTPAEFAQLYNIAQLVTAPVLAVSANSPILFGKRLWYESRIAVFQQSIDTRTSSDHLRHQKPRVMFGSKWLDNSIMEIYKEDIARFRVLLSTDMEEDVFKLIKEGTTPKLRALSVHNGTVYRWNRPCYGISENGQPHLRIENRALPAGPSVVDEMASAAFWLGLMRGVHQEYGDIRKLISFDEVGHNFLASARTGITSKFNWIGAKQVDVCELVKEELIPLAKQGLESQNINSEDIDRYMDIIGHRADKARTGAQWMLNSYRELSPHISKEEVLRTITFATISRQMEGSPVHEWELANESDVKEYAPVNLLVEEFMETDLYTVRKDDLLELVAELMDWNKIRYMPVENKAGELEGLITARILLRYFSKKHIEGERKKPVSVKSMMIKDPITVSPDEPITNVIDILTKNNIGCIPVVKDGKLVGIVTQADFMAISSSMIKRLAKKEAE